MDKRWFVLSGAPGAGKTTLLAELSRRGYATVAEAATDLIEERQAAGVDGPWRQAGFLDEIVAVQLDRARQAATWDPQLPVVFDRSPVCSLALAWYSRLPVGAALAAAAAQTAGPFGRRVLMVADLGFVVPTAVRRISHRNAVRFGAVHREAYRKYGFAIVEVPRATVSQRADLVEATIAAAS